MKKKEKNPNGAITSAEGEMQKRKAMKTLDMAKKLESKKMGYRFVKINERTRVFRKV